MANTMIRARLANARVELVSPFQTDGKFMDDEEGFWKNRTPNYYKIYLLVEDFISEGKYAGCSLFWVDTGFCETMFLGKLKY